MEKVTVKFVSLCSQSMFWCIPAYFSFAYIATLWSAFMHEFNFFKRHAFAMLSIISMFFFFLLHKKYISAFFAHLSKAHLMQFKDHFRCNCSFLYRVLLLVFIFPFYLFCFGNSAFIFITFRHFVYIYQRQSISAKRK